MIVFVHGVPEAAALWDRVRAAIDHESVAVALPGFGVPLPPGFAATKDAYVEWLLGELDGIDERVHLVGHDWGAGLTYRVATAHGDRLRSWVGDVATIAHPDYRWHDAAQLWQAPGEGEAFAEALADLPADDKAAAFVAMGVPGDDAREMAGWFDRRMGECVLALYRSAVPNLHASWGSWTRTAAPGLVLHPSDDPFDQEQQAREVADALGADLAILDGVGHFWPYQAPERAAAVLEGFWAGTR